MRRLIVVVHDSVHDEDKIYSNIDEIKIKDDTFKLIEHYDDGEHIYVFSTRYSIVEIICED